jgi:hypothetical protein
VVRRARAIALLLLFGPGLLTAQGNARRFTTIDALRQFPGYYHLQTVTLRGELSDDPQRPTLRADDIDMRVLFEGASPKSGPVEVRGTVVDVGRLEPNDPRLGGYAEGRGAENWPKPGEELVLRVTNVAEATPATAPSVRALALEPWKFDGQTVTVIGNFRGRNLFGDTPAAPAGGRYDFVLRGAEGAVWVTGMRPRGKNFDLDLERRIDTDKWIEVTGVVSRTRGLVAIAATKITLAERPETKVTEDTTPPPPPVPLQVVFSSPTDGEVDVSPAAPIRIQFARGLRESTIAGKVRVSYVGDAATTLDPKVTYDAATRALQIRFATPLDPFKTVKVELLDGLLAFDGGPLAAPWTVTFSLGGR